MHEAHAHTIREIAEQIYDDGYTEQADRLAQVAYAIERPAPELNEPEEWERLVREGGKRFGWAWIDYQSKVLAVFDSLGLERGDYRLLAVKLALTLGAEVERAVEKVRSERAIAASA